ncbi:aminotransferase class IV [Nocardioides acrostichi]|uniref:Aminotransferase class IV n=1 Tax=Nocardioides acrostichi TaxID=2784339 RepID=A0A930UWN4_9ACTN|nr:aminotransferase class IV [Nocardioides acrostichi]MBF4162223.1 aminotransferase class IV [Nocardioides acrostichi]
MRAWADGRLLNRADEAVLPVTDHGVTVGDGVFESVKVVDGRPFALDLHLDRLVRSAAGLGLIEPSRSDVLTGVRAVLAEEHLPLGRLRITLTGGPAPLGSGRGDSPGTLMVVAAPMAPLSASTSVVTVSWTRNENSATAGLKTTSYADNVIALAEAARRGASEAIFANTRGELCEGTGSNVFYVVDGELRTPSLASGCLAGVTRALVLEWVEAVEVDEPLEVAAGAEEVFLVSTTRDVQAVTRWNERELAAPGPVTRAAAAVWRERAPELFKGVEDSAAPM